MKTVDITVHFTAKVPDNVDTGSLFIDVDTSRINIMAITTTPAPVEVVGAKVTEYETVNVEELVD